MNRKPNLNDFNFPNIESEEYGPLSELDYRFLEYMQEGVIVSSVIRDDQGKVIDLILKYANVAAYRQRKDLKEGLIEKSIKEIYTSEEAAFDLKKANEAINTGRGIQYEVYRAELDKYFNITAFSPNEDIYITFSNDITTRIKAEQNIINERKKLLEIIEFLPDATFVINEKKEVIAWNNAIEEMTGVEKKDILGKDEYAYSIPFYGYKRPILIDLIFLKEEEIETKYSYVKREGNTLFAEVYVKNLYDGRGAYVFVKASALYDHEGNLVGSIETVRDITQQKKDEMNLLESENKFRSTIEQSTDGISLIDEEGIIIEWNKGMEIITGINREKELGKSIWESQYELMPDEEKTPEVYDYIKGTIIEFLQTEKADWINKPLDRRIKRTDGEIRFIQSVTYPIKTKKGTIIGSITRDITEKEKIEKALKDSEAKFKAFFELKAVGTFIIDQNGHFVKVNEKFSKITGHTPKELYNRNFTEFIHPDDRMQVIAKFKELIKDEIPLYDIKTRYMSKDGQIILIHLAINLIKDTQGKLISCVGIISKVKKNIEI